MDKYFLRLRKEDFLKFEVHEFPNCLDNGRLWYDVWIYYKMNDTVYCALVNNSASRTSSDAKKKIKQYLEIIDKEEILQIFQPGREDPPYHLFNK
jgi:hypothetical protein